MTLLLARLDAGCDQKISHGSHSAPLGVRAGMGPMEHRTDATKRNPDPAARPLADIRPYAAQERFDLCPSQIGGRRFGE